MVFNKKNHQKSSSSPIKAEATRKRNLPSDDFAKLTINTSNITIMHIKNSIDVIVRVRPYNERELQDNSKTAIKVIDDKMLIFDPKEQETYPFHNLAQRCRNLLKKQNKQLKFTFDKIFNSTSTNNDVFEGSTKGLITKLLDGRNCLIFAYGATGAGKTHTIHGLKEALGLMYYTVIELFIEIEKRSEHHEFHLSVSAMEIYNETVKDLLYKSNCNLKLRENDRREVVATGLRKYTVQNAGLLLAWLAVSHRNRTRHTTDGNSTRSHAVFRIYIKIINKLNNKTQQVKLSMIDLAGFQRVPAAGYKDVRFLESVNINKSLMALDNCINSLARGKKYIPYRDSKLTRLLKDSFDDMCHIIMIANISPSSLSYEDTYHTLKYANLAKKIKSYTQDATWEIYW